MDSSVITGLFTLSGTVFGSLASVIISIYTIKHEDVSYKQKKIIKEILENLNGFHELEEVYIQKLISLRNERNDKAFITHDSIVKETRKELRNKNIDFDFSPSDINYYTKKLDIK